MSYIYHVSELFVDKNIGKGNINSLPLTNRLPDTTACS